MPRPRAPCAERTGNLPWSCITGRLSTVDPRYAAIDLGNSPSCVKRFGGASGEAPVVRRSSPHSRQWRQTGESLSDNCPASSTIPRAVRRDLGCSQFFGGGAVGSATRACGTVPIDYRPTKSEHYTEMYVSAPSSLSCSTARILMRRYLRDERPCSDSSCNRSYPDGCRPVMQPRLASGR